MKTLRRLIALVSIAFAWPAFAQTDITGTWAGDLPISPDATLEIHFIVSQDGDGYSTVLTSPNPGGPQNLAVTSTSFDGTRLELDVAALSGRYEGTLTNGSFSGNWIQQDQEIPLALVPFVETVLSDADKDRLRGSWVGELSVEGITLAIVLRFEDNEAGEFVGFLDSPDQGANGIPVANIEFADDALSLDIPTISASYTASFSGENLLGSFSQLGQPVPLELGRGEYVERGIELSQAAIDRLAGSWVGQVQNPAGGTLAIVFRFEARDDGGLAAFLDSPDQGASGIPINEVTLEGDELALVIAAAQASYTATLSADAMTGSWAQGNSAQAVTMNRGEYTPAVAVLDVSDEAWAALAGVWSGELGPLEVFFRFETTADGSRVGFLDVPAQGAEGLAVPELVLEGDTVTLRIPALGVTYTGTLSGSEIAGNWQQAQTSNPLNLSKTD